MSTIEKRIESLALSFDQRVQVIATETAVCFQRHHGSNTRARLVAVLRANDKKRTDLERRVYREAADMLRTWQVSKLDEERRTHPC